MHFIRNQSAQLDLSVGEQPGEQERHSFGLFPGLSLHFDRHVHFRPDYCAIFRRIRPGAKTPPTCEKFGLCNQTRRSSVLNSCLIATNIFLCKFWTLRVVVCCIYFLFDELRCNVLCNAMLSSEKNFVFIRWLKYVTFQFYELEFNSIDLPSLPYICLIMLQYSSYVLYLVN